MPEEFVNHDDRQSTRYRDPNTVTWVDPLMVDISTERDDFVGLAIPDVLDESASGIALGFESMPRLRLGDEVAITHNGTTRRAVVRNLIPIESGRTRVGFEWVDE